MEDRKLRDQLRLKSIGQSHNDRKDHRRCADNRRADQNGFGRGFESVSGAVVFFEVFLRLLKLRRESEILFNVFMNSLDLFDG